MPNKQYHALVYRDTETQRVTSYAVSTVDADVARAQKYKKNEFVIAEFFVRSNQTEEQASKLVDATVKALNAAYDVSQKVLEQNFLRSMHT